MFIDPIVIQVYPIDAVTCLSNRFWLLLQDALACFAINAHLCGRLKLKLVQMSTLAPRHACQEAIDDWQAGRDRSRLRTCIHYTSQLLVQ
jgi:hypothetical protein